MGIGGLHRLIQNNYQFTISERTAANLKEAMEQGNNILGFLKSEGYFEIRQGAKCKSTDFYKVYERWCLDNLEKAAGCIHLYPPSKRQSEKSGHCL